MPYDPMLDAARRAAAKLSPPEDIVLLLRAQQTDLQEAKKIMESAAQEIEQLRVDLVTAHLKNKPLPPIAQPVPPAPRDYLRAAIELLRLGSEK